MRLSAWREAAPAKDGVSPKVSAVVDTVLASLGAESDPHGFVVWGEEPSARYTIMVPTGVGLVSVQVRVNVPGEGPRAHAKLVRWPKLQIGELAIEMSGGHRVVNFQADTLILNGRDEMADRIAGFALVLIAAIDGRPWPSYEEPGAAT
ncbi:MAG TPA: hypothetical protein VK656_03885 [Candidatus Acidoferrum sp.]|jgi:hypothetical protein|nr:hypothetical protein [Candidatus Acidoferrum sp.]